MDLEKLMWEGPQAIVPPNKGRSTSFAWCAEDWRKFELSVRTAYPNVFFYEDLLNSEVSGEVEPQLRRIERLDRARPECGIHMLFPDPAWKPKLIRRPNRAGKIVWMFDQYWSPILWTGWARMAPTHDVSWHNEGEQPARYWPGNMIQSSFRHQFEHEVECEAKIMNLARKIGRRMVLILWPTLADFHAGKGQVYRWFRTSASFYASDGVIDWYRQNPTATIAVRSPKRSAWGFSYMPPEDVPEHFWGDVKKPKWVLEAIEKYRR